MFQNRPYQDEMHNKSVRLIRGGAKAVCAVLPTGGGKTRVATCIASTLGLNVLSVAHRKELIGQMSLSYAREQIPHRIFGPQTLIAYAIGLHRKHCGRVFYDPSAPHAVGSVDTLVKRFDTDEWRNFSSSVGLLKIDECHHMLRDNKWGAVRDQLPEIPLLGMTAETRRADGRGIGLSADGYFTDLIIGPTMQELIDAGYLSPFRVLFPSRFSQENGHVGSTGDYTQKSTEDMVKKSSVIGDAVATYTKYAHGKLGLFFLPSVALARETSERFNDAGIPAECVSGKTEPTIRDQIFERFANREIWALINVDVAGEGTDIPACEYVGMLRPTMSYGLYKQQFGRMLRIDPANPGKVAILADHVRNIAPKKEGGAGHGLPTKQRHYSLDGWKRGRTTPVDSIPMTECSACTFAYERFLKKCPSCGHVPVPLQRSGPEFVDGDLTELSPEALARLAGEEIDLNGLPLVRVDAGQGERLKRQKDHAALIVAQKQLRDAIAQWSGYALALGVQDTGERQRMFYLKFEIDTLSAKSLRRADAEKLRMRIEHDIQSLHAEWEALGHAI